VERPIAKTLSIDISYREQRYVVCYPVNLARPGGWFSLAQDPPRGGDILGINSDRLFNFFTTVKYTCRLQADIIYCEHQEPVIVGVGSHLQARFTSLM